MPKYFAALALAGILASLSACGMKGPLVLPPGPAPEPLLGHPKPAAKPAETKPQTAKPEDVSTDKNPSPQ